MLSVPRAIAAIQALFSTSDAWTIGVQSNSFLEKMSMIEPNALSSGYPETCQLQDEKIVALSSTDSLDAITFSIKDEDHTIGNALRWIIMKNPNVSFCGYSIPHPSEFKIHFRIQTDGTITAYQALDKGLSDLMALGEDIKSEFLKASAK